MSLYYQPQTMHLFFGKFMEIPPISHRFLASKSPKKMGVSKLQDHFPHQMDRRGEAERLRIPGTLATFLLQFLFLGLGRPDMATICYDFIGSTLQKIQDISTYIRVPFKQKCHTLPMPLVVRVLMFLIFLLMFLISAKKYQDIV